MYQGKQTCLELLPLAALLQLLHGISALLQAFGGYDAAAECLKF
jgi:hypothetical protein